MSMAILRQRTVQNAQLNRLLLKFFFLKELFHKDHCESKQSIMKNARIILNDGQLNYFVGQFNERGGEAGQWEQFKTGLREKQHPRSAFKIEMLMTKRVDS